MMISTSSIPPVTLCLFCDTQSSIRFRVFVNALTVSGTVGVALPYVSSVRLATCILVSASITSTIIAAFPYGDPSTVALILAAVVEVKIHPTGLCFRAVNH